MEFWGFKVKAGERLKVVIGLGKLVHISQAAIGELKDVKGPKNVPLRLKTDGNKKIIIGYLSCEDQPQVMFDLVFTKDFKLSHGLKKGSVYFLGYTVDDPYFVGKGKKGDNSILASSESTGKTPKGLSKRKQSKKRQAESAEKAPACSQES